MLVESVTLELFFPMALRKKIFRVFTKNFPNFCRLAYEESIFSNSVKVRYRDNDRCLLHSTSTLKISRRKKKFFLLPFNFAMTLSTHFIDVDKVRGNIQNIFFASWRMFIAIVCVKWSLSGERLMGNEIKYEKRTQLSSLFSSSFEGWDVD